MEHKRIPDARKTRGQVAVEAAIVIPFLIIILAGIVQASWSIFVASSISPAITHAQYSITAADMAAGADANELLRERMIEAAPALASGTLTVTEAKITVASDADVIEQLDDDDFDKYLVATKNERTTRANITAHVEYEPVTLLSLFGHARFVRDVDASKIVEERFELG